MLLKKGNAFGKGECFWKRGMLLEKGNAFGKEEFLDQLFGPTYDIRNAIGNWCKSMDQNS
jgi:hypothetical protein